MLSILAKIFTSEPVDPRSSLIWSISYEAEANGIAIKSIMVYWEMVARSVISWVVTKGKLLCLPDVNLHWDNWQIIPPIFISILHPSAWISIIIPTTFPSSKYTTSFGFKYLIMSTQLILKWFGSEARSFGFPHESYTIEPDLILINPFFSFVCDILISLPLTSNIKPHYLWGLSLFASLNFLISLKFDLRVPWLRFILAIDMPASNILIISITSSVLGLYYKTNINNFKKYYLPKSTDNLSFSLCIIDLSENIFSFYFSKFYSFTLWAFFITIFFFESTITLY